MQALLALQALAQLDSDRTGHGLARQPGEFASQLACFIVLDVEAHHFFSSQVELKYKVYPTLSACQPKIEIPLFTQVKQAHRENENGIMYLDTNEDKLTIHNALPDRWCKLLN